MTASELDGLLKHFGSAKRSMADIALEDIVEWDMLEELWRMTAPASEEEKRTEKRMKEVLDGTYSWDELAIMWDETPSDCAPEAIIQEQMSLVLIRLLPEVSCWDELLTMRTKTADKSVPQWQIEQRMEELVGSQTDWDELVMMRKKTSRASTPRKQIDARMQTLIDNVDGGECPRWFLILLHKPGVCPVRYALDKKIRQLINRIRPETG